LEQGKEDINRWKNFLDENNFPGIHVVAENQFRNEQIQPFMINSAPSYMLIDKEGKIANPTAPKPDAVETAINDLL